MLRLFRCLSGRFTVRLLRRTIESDGLARLEPRAHGYSYVVRYPELDVATRPALARLRPHERAPGGFVAENRSERHHRGVLLGVEHNVRTDGEVGDHTRVHLFELEPDRDFLDEARALSALLRHA